jgi:putative two-component system hydrogenase maturation factor HypX/HoxX
MIEAAENPADESWHNINAMNDLVLEILSIQNKLVVSALQGNAGAGGVILALAADYVWSRPGVVLNPHYQGMGGLYGSEYWTYLLPKRVGAERATALTEELLPVGAEAALAMGLVDDVFGPARAAFPAKVAALADDLAHKKRYPTLLAAKYGRRRLDEARKPLAAYREEELARMRRNFYGPDRAYHEARRNFVYKTAGREPEVMPQREPEVLAVGQRRSA